MATISEALATAVEHHRAGRLRDAENAYRQVLQVEPRHADGWHLLGLVYLGLQQLDEAVACQRRALEFKPTFAEAHYRLGTVLHTQGKELDEAVRCYRRAVALKPEYVEAYNSLGSALSDRGDLEEAVACYRRALGLKPNHAGVSNNLGVALKAQGKLDEAVIVLRRILTLQPDLAEAHNNLGSTLDQQGNLIEAEASYRRAIQVRPKYAAAHHGLGGVLQKQKKLDEAVAYYRQALALNPGFADTHNNLAVALKDQGKLDEAVACYRRALELKPNHAGASNNLGVALKAQGKLDEAVVAFRWTLTLKPDLAEAHSNLGSALEEQGNLVEAEACYRRAIQIRPKYPAAHHGLGAVLQKQKKLEEAVACYQQALTLNPDFAATYNNLAVALKDQGKLDEAVACYRQALALKPGYAEAYNNLGNVLHEQGKLDEAIACCRQAVALNSGFAEAHNNLGNALRISGKLDEAMACFRQALALNPQYAEAYNNLGIALQAQGKLGEAADCCRQALALKPEFALAHNSLGIALQAQGKLTEAVACFQQALTFKPEFTKAHSNLLLVLQYQADVTVAKLAEAHAEFERQLAAPLHNSWQPQIRSRDPERRLKLGFVSADFGRHPVGSFLIRTLEHLDQQQAEIVCYSDRRVEDELTARFQAIASTWRKVVGWSDERLADQIREDEIDILFDLAGHTADNRMLVFARKPAPIQITWLGYVGTTGLKAIDYLIADHHEIPADAESDYQEKILRMPDGYVCYDPPSYAPPVSPLPALEKGFVTFGCLNNPVKLTASVIAVWARILQQVPNCRLVLKYQGLSDRVVSGRIADLFAGQGIDVGRIEFLGQSPHNELLAEYGRIDLALDSFPYSGGLTTCEAMWMGVPVITTPGETFAGRHSLSHLSNVGLTETIARDLDEYVNLAVGLAQDLDRLAVIRSRLREQVAASPLCDGPRFAANLLSQLRVTWRHWVETRQA